MATLTSKTPKSPQPKRYSGNPSTMSATSSLKPNQAHKSGSPKQAIRSAETILVRPSHPYLMRPDTGKKWHVRRLATSSWICFGIRCRIIRVSRTFPLWIRTISLYLICLARKAGAGVIMKEKTWGIGIERVKIEIGGWSPED